MFQSVSPTKLVRCITPLTRYWPAMVNRPNLTRPVSMVLTVKRSVFDITLFIRLDAPAFNIKVEACPASPPSQPAFCRAPVSHECAGAMLDAILCSSPVVAGLPNRPINVPNHTPLPNP